MIQRNVLQNELLTLSGLILEDIVPSAELEAQFLRECYSQSGQLSQSLSHQNRFLVSIRVDIFSELAQPADGSGRNEGGPFR